MPHVVLQYSKNVKLENSKEFFKKLHQILSKMLPTEISTCKSRVIPVNEYFISDNDNQSNLAFVHLEIAIMSGRSNHVLEDTMNSVIEELKNYLFEHNKNLQLEITVELREIGKYYAKRNLGN